MRGNPFFGFGYLLKGAGLLTKPGVRRYVAIPLIINILLFSALILYAYQQFGVWVGIAIDWLPGWLSFLDWLLWSIFASLIFVVVVFTFTLVANFIAAPFNGFLAEAVETHLTGTPADVPSRPIAREIVASLARELVKMSYYLPRALLLLIFSFVPLINTVAPLLWFLFGAWMMAIQYMDYPMDNHRIGFVDMKERLKTQRLTPLGFGASVLLVAMVPLLNLIVMPAAVAGATACWVSDFRNQNA